jgi:hypothetical protein
LPNSTSSGFSIKGDVNSHEKKIQSNIWSDVQLQPSFQYIPLVGPPGSVIADNGSESDSEEEDDEEKGEWYSDVM